MRIKTREWTMMKRIKSTPKFYYSKDLIYFSINLLVVYRESMNLIGYITLRLSADSLQL